MLKIILLFFVRNNVIRNLRWADGFLSALNETKYLIESVL